MGRRQVVLTDYTRSNSSFDMPRSLMTALTVPGLRSLPRQFGIAVVDLVASFAQISWSPFPWRANSQPRLRSLRVSSL